MGGSSHGHASGGGLAVTRVTVDIAALEALPLRTRGMPVDWAPDEDEALRKYWPTRNHTDVARLLGKSRDACEKRYQVLTRGK